MSRTNNTDRIKVISDRALTPVLIDGDASELLEVLRESSLASSIPISDHAAAAHPAQVVILAIERDGRRSSLTKASKLLREMNDVIAEDAVRIVVIQSSRSRITPTRLLRLLTSEILFQVAVAFDPMQKLGKSRSIRQRIGLATLDAAGLRILRFG